MKALLIIASLFFAQHASAKGCKTTMDTSALGGKSTWILCSETANLPEEHIVELCSAKPENDMIKTKFELLDKCGANYIAKCERTGAQVKLALAKIPKETKKPKLDKLPDNAQFVTYYYTAADLDTHKLTCMDGKWSDKKK